MILTDILEFGMRLPALPTGRQAGGRDCGVKLLMS